MLNRLFVIIIVVSGIMLIRSDNRCNKWKDIALTNADAVTELLVISQRQSKLINEQKEILTILTKRSN